MKILIVEDDADLNENIYSALLSEQYAVDRAYDGDMALKLLSRSNYDCVVLDVNLPKLTGYEVCKEMRQQNILTPVLLLTALGELDDKIKGFDLGADDYMTKPFFMRELLARVQVLSRRQFMQTSSSDEQSLSFDEIVIYPNRKKVFRAQQEIDLTAREYQILYLLVEKSGDIISKNELIKNVWGGSVATNINSLEVYINFLRKKIDKPFSKSLIKTKVGFGYYLASNED